jgi:hypothetical protein
MSNYIKGGELFLADRLDPIVLDSREFLQLAAMGFNCRFEGNDGNITINCDKKGYFTASKKVNGSLRRKRIGNCYDMTQEQLEDTCSLICRTELWREYRAWLTDKRKNRKEALRDKNKELETKLLKKDQEIFRLKQRVVELQQEIARLEFDPEEYI